MSEKSQEQREKNKETVKFLIEQFTELLLIVKTCAEKFTEIREKVEDISAEEFEKLCEENDGLLKISMMVNEQIEIILNND